MADWLKNKPAKSENMGLAPDQIKGNWEYLEDSLQRDHDFPGSYGSSGRHNKVTLLDVGEETPSDPSGNDRIIYAKDGAVYIVNDSGQIIFALTSDELSAMKFVAGQNREAGLDNDAGSLKLWSEGDNDYYVQVTTREQDESYTLKLPKEQGGENQLLVNDGSGNLSWEDWFQNQLLHVEDRRAVGTDGGLFEEGAWRTRELNTVVTNEIPGATLSNDRVTLPPGTYEAQWSAPAFTVNLHKSRLFNVTGDEMLLEGSSEDCVIDVNVQTISVGFGRFTLTEESEIELQHQCHTSRSKGFGRSTDGLFADVDHETYSILKIRKVP